MEYFRVVRPTEPALPIVVDVPHAGVWIPDDVLAEMAVGDQVLRRDLDLYVDELWSGAPELGATMIASNVSRYVLDLNRAQDDVSPRTVDGGKRIDKPGYYHDRGVVWRTTTDGRTVMSRPLSREQFRRRVDTFWAPYHAAIRAEVERVRERFGYCILVDGHSMPSTGRAGHVDSGVRRADIVPGDVDGTSCAAAVTNLLQEHFGSAGYSVAPNEPYKGGWITRSFGAPGSGVHAIQVEVNRAIYMDEQTFERRVVPMQRLSEACVSVLPKLAALDLRESV